MNMKKIVSLFLAVLLSVSYSVGQGKANLLNAKTVAQIGVKSKERIKADNTEKPLDYGMTKDDDILWSKVVWEVIDLNQKINHNYYFPIDSTLGSTRLSLYNTLNKALKQKKFKTYEDSYFIDEKPVEKIQEELSAVCVKSQITETVSPADFDHFKIKGIWFFDKRQGELRYRLLAIAPLIGFDAKKKCGIEEDRERSEMDGEEFVYPTPKELRPLYWAYFPEVRQILHESKVFNSKNGSRPISYDHLLNSRRFSAIIVQEENIYGNRVIEDFVRGNSLFQLLEADKIKEDIRNKEIDMWNY
jgi:gliding motility associated protien GldN